MRVLALLLVVAGALSACAAPPAAAPGPTLAQASPAPVPPVASPAPTPPPAYIRADGKSVDLADYMYGPPPHDRIDRRVRCRFDCPKYPPGSLLLMR